jgi:hypothetical protein
MGSKIKIFSDGINIRKHNTSISLIEKEDRIELLFGKYVGKGIVTAQTANNRGVAVLKFHLEKETMLEISSAWMQYLIAKDERDSNLPEQTQRST